MLTICLVLGELFHAGFVMSRFLQCKVRFLFDTHFVLIIVDALADSWHTAIYRLRCIAKQGNNALCSIRLSVPQICGKEAPFTLAAQGPHVISPLSFSSGLVRGTCKMFARHG